MTTREFIMHLLMNCELDDPVSIEVRVPKDYNTQTLFHVVPAHAYQVGGEVFEHETLIETKLQEGN